MEKFLFRAKNWKGTTVKGVVESESRKGAVTLLKERNLVVISIHPQKKTFLDRFKVLLFARVTLAQLTTFTRQLATMINAGLPLTDSLELIKEQVKGKMLDIVDEALARVQGGESLAKALEKERKNFGDVYLASIKAGEEGGVLEEVILRLADNLEKKKEFTGRVKGAMIYPMIVIVGMVVVVFIMMVFVLPKMTAMYSEFDADLPLPTKILMTAADFTSTNALLFPAGIVALIIAFKVLTARKEIKIKIDGMKLKIPIIGPLTKSIALTEITRTLSTLVGTGVPLVDCLKIVSESSDNEVFREGLERSSRLVEKGTSLAESFSDNPVFPVIVRQMIATGEETGSLDKILANVSSYFETESNQAVKNLTTAIEPLIMVVLGLGVAFLMIAIIMPIYNLTSQF